MLVLPELLRRAMQLLGLAASGRALYRFVIRPLVAVTAVVCVLFWVARGLAVRAHSEYQRLVELRPDGPLLNGLTVHLAGTAALTVVDAVESATVPRTLILALSDDCPGAGALMPTWEQLFPNLARDGSVQVAIVTFRGDTRARALADRLKPLGVPHAIYRVNEPRAFQSETGISSTPMTIVLDRSGRMQVISVGTEPQQEPRVLALIARHVNHDVGGSTP